jgi:uncharacterized membrane protein YdjX (TVP38/TMEM64 family)
MTCGHPPPSRAAGLATIAPMMDIAMTLIDFILHVDRHLSEFVAAYGGWVYALLFLIIFVETGLVVMPFLPGDSLLFVVGALCGLGLMSLPLAMLLLTIAAIAGNQTNYAIGRASARGSSAGRSHAGSTARPSTACTRFMNATAASPSWPRASCPSCAPSRPSWPAWRR